MTGEHAVDLEVERRVDVVTALGSIDTSDAEAGVVYALRDSDVRVLLAAVRALRPAPSPRAAKELASAAATWREPAYDAARAAAIQLLIDARDELYAVEYAQTLIDDERRNSLRPEEEASVRALFAADSGSVAELMADDLALSLGAADERERELAFQTLVAMGPVSVRALISGLDDPDRRRSAAAALGAVRDSRAVPALTKLLSSQDAAARAAAARALGQIRDPGAIDGLVGVSADPDPDVRDAALDALDGMRGLLLAILGTATAHAGEQPNRLPSPDHAGEVDAPRLPQGALQRSLLQRLLGHEH